MATVIPGTPALARHQRTPAQLLADGLITEREPEGSHAGHRGRPAALLTPSRPPGHVVGIDFGHAHVGVAIADTAGEVLAESRLGADVDHRADEVLDTSARMTRDLLSQAGVPLSQVIAIV